MILFTCIRWSPEAFSSRESSIKMQKASSLPDTMPDPCGSSRVPELASSLCIHSTCPSSPIQPNSQPFSLVSPGLLLPSQDLAGFTPSLCMFTTKFPVSGSLHWFTSPSLQIPQHHEIYHPHQHTLESESRQYISIMLGTRDLNLQT